MGLASVIFNNQLRLRRQDAEPMHGFLGLLDPALDIEMLDEERRKSQCMSVDHHQCVATSYAGRPEPHTGKTLIVVRIGLIISTFHLKDS